MNFRRVRSFNLSLPRETDRVILRSGIILKWKKDLKSCSFLNTTTTNSLLYFHRFQLNVSMFTPGYISQCNIAWDARNMRLEIWTYIIHTIWCNILALSRLYFFIHLCTFLYTWSYFSQLCLCFFPELKVTHIHIQELQ